MLRRAVDQALDAAPDGEAQQCIRFVLTKRLSDAEVLQHVKREGRPTRATRKIAGSSPGASAEDLRPASE